MKNLQLISLLNTKLRNSVQSLRPIYFSKHSYDVVNTNQGTSSKFQNMTKIGESIPVDKKLVYKSSDSSLEPLTFLQTDCGEHVSLRLRPMPNDLSHASAKTSSKVIFHNNTIESPQIIDHRDRSSIPCHFDKNGSGAFRLNEEFQNELDNLAILSDIYKGSLLFLFTYYHERILIMFKKTAKPELDRLISFPEDNWDPLFLSMIFNLSVVSNHILLSQYNLLKYRKMILNRYDSDSNCNSGVNYHYQSLESLYNQYNKLFGSFWSKKYLIDILDSVIMKNNFTKKDFEKKNLKKDKKLKLLSSNIKIMNEFIIKSSLSILIENCLKVLKEKQKQNFPGLKENFKRVNRNFPFLTEVPFNKNIFSKIGNKFGSSILEDNLSLIKLFNQDNFLEVVKLFLINLNKDEQCKRFLSAEIFTPLLRIIILIHNDDDKFLFNNFSNTIKFWDFSRVINDVSVVQVLNKLIEWVFSNREKSIFISNKGRIAITKSVIDKIISDSIYVSLIPLNYSKIRYHLRKYIKIIDVFLNVIANPFNQRDYRLASGDYLDLIDYIQNTKLSVNNRNGNGKNCYNFQDLLYLHFEKQLILKLIKTKNLKIVQKIIRNPRIKDNFYEYMDQIQKSEAEIFESPYTSSRIKIASELLEQFSKKPTSIEKARGLMTSLLLKIRKSKRTEPYIKYIGSIGIGLLQNPHIDFRILRMCISYQKIVEREFNSTLGKKYLIELVSSYIRYCLKSKNINGGFLNFLFSLCKKYRVEEKHYQRWAKELEKIKFKSKRQAHWTTIEGQTYLKRQQRRQKKSALHPASYASLKKPL
ncbi:uncharacterized protein ASCRUDRAFT_69660 [Ascoidea rubescens DSM 1968]|uniref:Uncharacterized protein n=1 Tax=Ascoidea rubescens DSM 1968 TaxID=1344418 RepID=A0A1D2VK25_9ASCO|nr:hypothetical protein ASCRUDRAFT_69660 [Ascoidea rubescens DSM 1968]ODV61948.1 hypothetical protein ASCRUDRAFT_69660 [Ascoidea rubescens DSM 1968]